MIKPKTLFLLPVSVLLVLLLSAWGYQGHKKVSENAPPSFPQSLSFLLGSFSTILADSASAADYRKDSDPTEEFKHYIDIDNYQEFLLSGKIAQSYDSIIASHGEDWVIENGTLPWSTVTTFDSLKSCFARQDWNKAALVAADLGHYVGDGHQPLHITKSYDGWGNQNGVHSRYETRMINDYRDLITYPFDSAQLISDVRGFVFTYIYANNAYVDSVLLADLSATASTGSTSSSAYYQALWDKTKGFTIPLFHHASWTLASLIYTAYYEAQQMAVNELENSPARLFANYPNPVRNYTTIPFFIGKNNVNVSLRIVDPFGNVRSILVDKKMNKGLHEAKWEPQGLADGCYFCILQTDENISMQKVLLIR
jgi:hypothetical protein